MENLFAGALSCFIIALCYNVFWVLIISTIRIDGLMRDVINVYFKAKWLSFFIWVYNLGSVLFLVLCI